MNYLEIRSPFPFHRLKSDYKNSVYNRLPQFHVVEIVEKDTLFISVSLPPPIITIGGGGEAVAIVTTVRKADTGDDIRSSQ